MSLSTTCEPIKPHPPVTATRTCSPCCAISDRAHVKHDKLLRHRTRGSGAPQVCPGWAGQAGADGCVHVLWVTGGLPGTYRIWDTPVRARGTVGARVAATPLLNVPGPPAVVTTPHA